MWSTTNAKKVPRVSYRIQQIPKHRIGGFLFEGSVFKIASVMLMAMTTGDGRPMKWSEIRSVNFKLEKNDWSVDSTLPF